MFYGLIQTDDYETWEPLHSIEISILNDILFRLRQNPIDECVVDPLSFSYFLVSLSGAIVRYEMYVEDWWDEKAIIEQGYHPGKRIMRKQMNSFSEPKHIYIFKPSLDGFYPNEI